VAEHGGGANSDAATSLGGSGGGRVRVVDKCRRDVGAVAAESDGGWQRDGAVRRRAPSEPRVVAAGTTRVEEVAQRGRRSATR
jgi:hypothetical protein